QAFGLNAEGRHDEALSLLERLLAGTPDQADALQQKGIALMALGRLKKAEKAFLKGEALAPGDPNFTGNLGLIYHQSERYAEARGALEANLKLGVPTLKICLLYAEVLEKLGQSGLAIRFLGSVAGPIAAKVEVPLALSRLWLEAGDLGRALATARDAVRLAPGLSAALRQLARVAATAGRHPLALEQYALLTAAEPEDAELWSLYSQALFECSRNDEAVNAFRKSMELGEPTAEDHVTLGRLLFYAHDLEAAEAELEAAIVRRPDIAEAHSTLGRVAMIAGEREKSLAHLERALDANPDFVEAHFHYSRLSGREAGDPVLARLEALKTDPALAPNDRVNLGFSLGNFYNRLADYERAFENFAEGNRAARELAEAGGYGFKEAQERRWMEQVAAVFSRDFLETASDYGSDSELPVFVIGMPRSGTTLLEQIMASHSLAAGAGELDAVPGLHRELISEIGDDMAGPLADVLGQKAADWAARYLEAMPEAGAGVLRIVDKMPVNFLYAGFIRCLFPRARIIHIRRSGLDICVSMFTNKFSKSYTYATDLGDLGRYYRLYEALMDHWRKALPGAYLEVAYEDLVADQEAQSRRIIEFLGLEWEEACLEFHKTKERIFTFSASQVRKPMNASSVGRWRNYERHLGPLIKALEGD
ncbi:MAG: sulfotransferase, partial [Sphingomonadales bacterium]